MTEQYLKQKRSRYLTKAQAISKLQVSQKEFYKMCILKGIVPLIPARKEMGRGRKTSKFYRVKDIKRLSGDPIMKTTREQYRHGKRIRTAVAKRDWIEVEKLQAKEPKYQFEEIILGRYPRFTDAIRDLEDALNHVFILASIPQIEGLGWENIENCKRLCYEFINYIIHTRRLRKSFLSTRGVYFQVELEDNSVTELVTWIMPYSYGPQDVSGVDMDVMLTFLELYFNLLESVNIRLYRNEGLDYPPGIDPGYESCGFGIMAMYPYGNDSKIEKQPASLFDGLTIYVSREVPQDPVLFLILSLGGNVGWHGSPMAEDDPRITHHIIDRPAIQNLYPGRKYVQPQWIFDCCNCQKILDTDKYGINSDCPPHLSPFLGCNEELRNEVEPSLLTLSKTKRRKYNQIKEFRKKTWKASIKS